MAKNEFLVAITQLAAEKNLPKEVVFDAVEAALASAYKKDTLATSNVVVKIDPETGVTHVFTRRTVVEEVTDPVIEIAPEEARRLRPGAPLGEAIGVRGRGENVMSDFHQASVITTLHKLGGPNIESLEAELEQITAIRPVALVLPCLFSELETPAMPRIAEELLQVGYLREIVVALARANLAATQAQLDLLLAGPTKEQLEAAETQVRLA